MRKMRLTGYPSLQYHLCKEGIEISEAEPSLSPLLIRRNTPALPSWMTRSIAPIFGNSYMGNRWNRTPGVLRKGFRGITRQGTVFSETIAIAPYIGLFRIVTTPRYPSTVKSSPVLMAWAASGTPVTQGMPYSLATIAPWMSIPPRRSTIPPATETA